MVKEAGAPEGSTDHFGSHQAISLSPSSTLADRDAEADGCFDSFIAYISQHLREVTPQLKDLVLDMADAGRLFHGTKQARAGLT